jgi:hypothetical protein
MRTIALDLAKQLLILLTFAAGGVPGKESTAAPEELVIEAYGCLSALFRDLGVTPGGSTSLVEPGTIPALGHCVAVILEGITDGPSAEAQLNALNTLDAIWGNIKDPQALSNFLPGTISALTKCLMPGTATRRSRKTIVKALEVLQHVLVSLLGDIRTRNIRNENNPSDQVSSSRTEGKTLTGSWLKATTAQIKLALSNVIRLRSHESVEVKTALNKLCLTLLDECHDTLAESAPMLVETCMVLSGIDVEDNFSISGTTLIDLASIHPDLGDLVKNTVYNWVTSLPRVMQANDETAKQAALSHLSKAHDLLTGLNLESSTLDEALASSLRDSITVTLESSPAPKGLEEVEFDLNSQAAMTLASNSSLSTQFRPIIMAAQSQKHVRDQLAVLLSSIGTRQSQINMASKMLEYVRGASGPSLVSAYWLSAQILRSATTNNKDLDEFFESSLTSSDEQEAVNQELCSYSLSVLANQDEGHSDWRLQAIALEVMADAAQRMKEEFRTELVDTLYPIVQHLGSPNSRLREHAITCLNIVSRSCAYSSTSDLIVENVDYMVNAISLRLNTFDISPQAPQVLVMMIRLSGPSLLLYLDDVVASIFAALNNFHGYHRLVEVLFSVLGEIVSVGSKSGQLQITNTPEINHRKTIVATTTIEDILKILNPKHQPSEDPLPYEDFPQQHWKSAKTLLDEASASPPDKMEEDSEPPAETQKPPPTKTYTMLQSIARLSQHYLTSPSPVLRSKLLSLISTSSASLHNDEDAFLPLVNDIWPVVIKRLYDPEPYVQIAAADAISQLCQGAGDFLSTRISTEWSSIMKVARLAKSKVSKEKKGSAGRGIYSQNNQVWEAIIRLMINIVECVRVEDEMFDEVLDILGDFLYAREDVRGALEVANRDAAWLALHVAGKDRRLKAPVLKGYEFAPF